MTESTEERIKRQKASDQKRMAEMNAMATDIIKMEAKPIETKDDELTTIKIQLKEANKQYLAAIKAHREVMKQSKSMLSQSLAIKQKWYFERIKLAQEKKRLMN